MNKAQNILILTQKVDADDAVLGFFHRWLEEFSKNFENVIVVCLGEGTHTLPPNVRVLSLGKERGVSRFGYVVNFFSYIWKERKNYDVVFVHMNQIYVILGGLLWKMLGKKIGLWYTHSKVSASLKIAEWFADIVFTASHASFRLSSNKLHVVGHGIDTDVFKNLQTNVQAGDRAGGSQFKVLSVGRMSRVKDYETLVDAAKIVVSKNQNIAFEIIGGPLTAEDEQYAILIKEKIQKENLAEIITLTHSIPHKDIVKHISSADAFVNLSNTGSLDKAVLEAMACQLPVLVSNVAFTDMLSPHDLMFHSKNAEELAEKILTLEADSTKREELGRVLRDIVVRDHNLSGLIKKIKAIYETGR